MDRPKDFFLSYNKADKQWATWIAWQLEEVGYTTVLQSWDFQPGGNFVLEMDDATKQATRTIALLSPDYFTSKYTASEWAVAFRRDPKGEQGLLVPIRVRLCDVEGLLGPIGYIDLVDKNEASARTTLLTGVERKRRKPASAPTFPLASHADTKQPSFPGSSLDIGKTRPQPARFGLPFPELWNVPRRHSVFFTGRDLLLEEISEHFLPERQTGLVQPQAVVGLGGLGKTQVAAEYAYRYRRDYNAVLWLKAGTQESLVAGFRSLAEPLQLTIERLQERDSLIAATQEWFMAQSGWLLILDNADDLAVVDPFLPKAARGHILLTTRTEALGGLAQSSMLKPLNVDDGALCLLRRAGYLQGNKSLRDASTASMNAARRLSELMGGLPLALEQAGAYIEDTGCGVVKYLETYQRYRPEIQHMLHGAVPEYQLPVASAWKISKEIVEQTNPAASEILKLCAFLAPDTIPDEIFTQGASVLGPVLASVVVNTVAFDRAIGTLRSYSLLTREVDRETDIPRLSIHPIVQELLKDEMDLPTKQLWAERAVRAVFLALPIVEWPIIQAHVRSCILLVEQWNMTCYEAEQLRLRVEAMGGPGL